jgi:hypothetical protein
VAKSRVSYQDQQVLGSGRLSSLAVLRRKSFGPNTSQNHGPYLFTTSRIMYLQQTSPHQLPCYFSHHMNTEPSTQEYCSQRSLCHRLRRLPWKLHSSRPGFPSAYLLFPYHPTLHSLGPTRLQRHVSRLRRDAISGILFNSPFTRF